MGIDPSLMAAMTGQPGMGMPGMPMLPQPMAEEEYIVTPDGAEEDEPKYADPEARLSELLSLFKASEDFRRQYDEQALDWYKLFVGHVEELGEDRAGRSNLHIPATYEMLDTLRARLFKAFFGARPYIDFKPRPQSTQDLQSIEMDAKKAKLAAALLDEQLEKNGIQVKWYNWITSLLNFPAAVFGVGWRYETRKVRRRKQVKRTVVERQLSPDGAGVTMVPVEQLVDGQFQEVVEDAIVWDDNEIVHIDYFDFWPDPMGHDIDSCRYVWHRVYKTKPDIERELAVLENAGGGKVYNIDWEELRGVSGDIMSAQSERMSSIGYMQPTSDPDFGDEHTDRLAYHEVLHYWEDNRHAIVIDRKTVAYDGPNPYWRHGKKPFAVKSFDPLPGQFYGMSAVQVIEHLQAELNTLRNQRVDNVAFVLNRMWGVLRSSTLEPADLVSRPGAIIPMDRPEEAWAIPTPDVTQSSYQEEAILRSNMENALGVPAIIRGATPARKETATEVITKNTNASIRFDSKIMIIEEVFKRLAYLMDCNNQQFIDKTKVARQYGPDGAEQWAEITPDSVIGEWDYIPAGSSIDPAANRDIRREQLAQLVMTAIQTQNPYLDVYELTKQWVDSFEIRGLATALKTKEQIQQEQMQMQYQQMLMMAQAQQQAQMQAQQQQMAQQAQMAVSQGQQIPPELLQQAMAEQQAMQQAEQEAQAMALPQGIPPQAMARYIASDF